MVLIATQVKRRRGTTAENDAFTGAEGEITVDTEKHELRVHDGVTQGGFKIGSGSGSGRNIGDIFYTARNDTSLNGAVECGGGTYNTEDYEGDSSIGELLEAGKLPYVSLAQYATLLSTNGVVGVFGWDGTGTTTFRVPTLKDVFIECGQESELGDYVSAGLPNITGNTGGCVSNATPDGVFSQGAQAGTAGGGSGRFYVNNFDASRSSAIYGNSDTVQPKSIKYRAMVQLFNSTTDEAVATCTEVLADVADLKDLSNITATGKETIAHQAMPSGRFVNLTLGASGSTYTAPADGYVYFERGATSGNKYISLFNTSSGMASAGITISGISNAKIFLPVKKNDVFRASYNADTENPTFQFIYANGAQ